MTYYPKPIRQICVGAHGVGFIIEYRVTRDQVEDVFNSDGVLIEWRGNPVRPQGRGWGMVHSHSDNSTLWRRFVPWVGSLWRAAP